MRAFHFSDQTLSEIRHERVNHPHPLVQRKMNVLWLKSKGLTHDDVADLADVSVRSVQRYLDDYLDGGLDQVRRVPWKGKHPELGDHHASLEAHFKANPARSAREAQRDIERITGVRRGLTQVREFLKKNWAWPGARSARSRPRPTTPSRRPFSTAS